MNKRILVIDDEDHIRRMMLLTLEAAGYTVGEAHDGPEGLKIFGDGSGWDAVLLDQRMPGIDGLETLRRLKDAKRTARVIMTTAYASIELAVDAMKLGATDFVRKPMTPEILRNAVTASLLKELPVSSTLGPQASPGHSAASSSRATSEPLIQIITMNGFTILESEGSSQGPDERRFTVRSPAGDEHEVLVQIDEEAVGYVERMTRIALPPQNSFWTSQA